MNQLNPLNPWNQMTDGGEAVEPIRGEFATIDEAEGTFGDMKPISSVTAEDRALLQGRRAIIIEDEGITQMQLRRSLTKAGLVVVATAINGRDGVEAVLRERPDIVLLDIRMPIMDGIEAARQILAQYRVCIVMLTAFSDDTYRDEAQKIGASGYVIKPVTSDLLLPLMLQAYRRFHTQE